MGRLQVSHNPGGHTAVITHDGVVIGGISMTGPKTYSVKTEGRVPAIDGLSGASPREAWDEVVRKVRAGGVMYHDKVKVDPHDSDLK